MFPEPYWLLVTYSVLSYLYAFGVFILSRGDIEKAGLPPTFWSRVPRVTIMLLILRFYSLYANASSSAEFDHLAVLLQAVIIGGLSLALALEMGIARAVRRSGAGDDVDQAIGD